MNRPDGDEPRLPPGRLDPAADPDRFVPDGADAGASAGPPPRLDPTADPDRFPSDPTLTELLGDGSQEEQRDTYTWLLGLLSVLTFLALVAFAASRLGP